MNMQSIKFWKCVLILFIPFGVAAQADPGISDPKSALTTFGQLIPSGTPGSRGLFNIYQLSGRYYFEIPDSLLGRDFLIVTRIAKGPIDIHHDAYMGGAGRGFAHDEVGRTFFRFIKGPANNLFLEKPSFSIAEKDTTSPLNGLLQRSNLQSIAIAFDIRARGKEGNSSVIDLTNYISGDNELFSVSENEKSPLTLSGFQPDKSYTISVEGFPDNIRIRSFKTFGSERGTSSLELNNSLIMLPKIPMRPRYADPRLNYYAITSFMVFDPNLQEGAGKVEAINRYRLEPKDEDIERFKKGELVEPKKPIVFYIDPEIPARWQPYFIQAVNDWQKAFEKIGFKNAIIGKRAPTREEDSTWSMDDARYSAIYYKPTQTSNANALGICDPRSGEILECHVYVDHNLWLMMHDMYMILASPSDPRARHAHFDDELMGRLIRYNVAHEIGHALGLTHNMGASDATPVEKLRDRVWLEKFGHTSSIMDYARFNYVAQPGDSIGETGMFPRVNDYDEWSIEWGYKPIFDKSENEEKKILNVWIESKSTNKRLRFLNGENDPRALDECLSDNVIKANIYGIKNLQWELPRLAGWLAEDGKDFKDLDRVYRQLLDIFSEFISRVDPYIGGVYTDSKVYGEAGKVHTIVPKKRQMEAMEFLQRQIFKTPYWLLDTSVLNRISMPAEDPVSRIQTSELESLLKTDRLQRIIASSNRESNGYHLDEYLEALSSGIWSELNTHQQIDNYRRNLQKYFVDLLIKFQDPAKDPNAGGDLKDSDISSVARAILLELQSEIRSALPGEKDRLSRYHLQDMLGRIGKALVQ
jgi:hypothetical protein